MLTKRKKLFCDHYLITLNATKAAGLAGYLSKSPDGLKVKGYTLMQEDCVKEYIAANLKEKDQDLIIKQEEILEYLSSVIRGTGTEKQFFVLRTGGRSGADELVEKDVSLKARDRIKASELMAKIYKLMDHTPAKDTQIIIKNTIPRE